MAERLADHTTLRLGGPARTWLEPRYRGRPDRCRAHRGRDRSAPAGARRRIERGCRGRGFSTAPSCTPGGLRGARADDVAACSGAFMTVAAGEPWDAFVATTIGAGQVGIEALSGIPGLVGATPIQNVGAYGQEVSQTIARVRVYDRKERRVVTRSARSSATSATARRCSRHSRTGSWCSRSASSSGSARSPRRSGTPSSLARWASSRGSVPRWPRSAKPFSPLRRSKGMVVDPDDRDTWSAGSFFTNPVVDGALADGLPAEAPRYPAARRQGEDQRGLADRARRLQPRFRVGAGPAVHQAHARDHTTAAVPQLPTSSLWPARSATAWNTPTASGWCRSRCWWGSP